MSCSVGLGGVKGAQSESEYSAARRGASNVNGEWNILTDQTATSPSQRPASSGPDADGIIAAAPAGDTGLLKPVKSSWQEGAAGDFPPEDLPAVSDSLPDRQPSNEQEENDSETLSPGGSNTLAQHPRPDSQASLGASPTSAGGDIGSDVDQSISKGGTQATSSVKDAREAHPEQGSEPPEGETSGGANALSAELRPTDSSIASASTGPKSDAQAPGPGKESASEQSEAKMRGDEGSQSFAGELEDGPSVGESSSEKHSSGSETKEPRQSQPAESTHEAEPPIASGSSKEIVSESLHDPEDVSTENLPIESGANVAANEDLKAGQQSSGHLQTSPQAVSKEDDKARLNSNVDGLPQSKYDLSAFNDSDSEPGDLQLSQDATNHSSLSSHRPAGGPAELSQTHLDQPQQAAAVQNALGPCKSPSIAGSQTSERSFAASVDETSDAGAVPVDSLDLKDQLRGPNNKELQTKAAHIRDVPQATESSDGAVRSDSGLDAEPSPASSEQSLQDLAPAPLHAVGECSLRIHAPTPLA